MTANPNLTALLTAYTTLQTAENAFVRLRHERSVDTATGESPEPPS